MTLPHAFKDVTPPQFLASALATLGISKHQLVRLLQTGSERSLWEWLDGSHQPSFKATMRVMTLLRWQANGVRIAEIFSVNWKTGEIIEWKNYARYKHAVPRPNESRQAGQMQNNTGMANGSTERKEPPPYSSFTNPKLKSFRNPRQDRDRGAKNNGSPDGRNLPRIDRGGM